MLTAGDEIGRTQRGNNNAYCQDNEVSWLDWNLDGDQRALFAFVRRLLALRREYRVFRKRRFFVGAAMGEAERKDVIWLDETGAEMTETAWRDAERRALVMLINEASVETAPHGGRSRARTLVLAFNAGEESCELRLPRMPGVAGWRETINSARDSDDEKVGECLTLAAHSLALIVSEEA
jgi:glycogen operon protein